MPHLLQVARPCVRAQIHTQFCLTPGPIALQPYRKSPKARASYLGLDPAGSSCALLPLDNCAYGSTSVAQILMM